MKISRDNAELEEFEGRTRLLGAYWAQHNVIVLRDDLELDTLCNVMLHEVGHVIYEQTGLPRKLEELIIDTLTPHYLALIQDNPYFIEFLQRRGQC